MRLPKTRKESISEQISDDELLRTFDMDLAIKFMKPLGPSDSRGNTILPKDFDD